MEPETAARPMIKGLTHTILEGDSGGGKEAGLDFLDGYGSPKIQSVVGGMTREEQQEFFGEMERIMLKKLLDQTHPLQSGSLNLHYL